MIWLQLFPVVISLVVLAAHFLRGGNIVMVIAVFGLLALLVVRRRWVAQLVQMGLILGAVEWVITIIRLVAWRSETGQPVLRLVFILGGVALLTALSALVFRTARLRKWYDPVQTQSSIGA